MVAAASLDPDAVLWSAPPHERAGRPLLVLLHGYGSNEQDLFGLLPYLPDAFVVASVRAPLSPPFPVPGHSWFPIDGPQRRDPDQIAAAVTGLLEWLDDVRGDAAPVGLLGFSQGGAMALQVLRTRPDAAAFAVVLAGFALPGAVDGDEELAEVRPPVFWGRGSRDEVIAADLVAHTAQWLPDHVDLSGRVYADLAHSVSEDELADVRVFLEKRLAATAG